MVNTFRKKDILIMCSNSSRNAWKYRHSSFLLHILQNYTLHTLCSEPHKVCNGEGKLLGLPLNRALTDPHGMPYDIVCGTFFLAGVGEEHFTSLTGEQLKRYQAKYSRELVFTATDRANRDKTKKKERDPHER